MTCIVTKGVRNPLAAVALGVAGFAVTITAHAGCGAAPRRSNRTPGSRRRQPRHCSLRTHRQVAGARIVSTADDHGWSGEPGIVGLWRFQLVAPNGAVVDDGYAQWHSDGTEIQNSGLHAPITSNFCLGVWKQVGPT